MLAFKLGIQLELDFGLLLGGDGSEEIKELIEVLCRFVGIFDG
jgi:hypothetical protein